MKQKLIECLKLPEDLQKLSFDELTQVSAELREVMIATLMEIGGHFAANLGVVELSVALHASFDSPKDKIIWDVGHQGYPHKMLTGRLKQIHTIRQDGGLSGFLKRSENPHDQFGAGHASTSISAALGMAKARDAKGENHAVVAIIGDSSLSGGMALEALNNVQKTKNFVVILNDNNMSISGPTGALAEMFTRMRTTETYQGIKHRVDRVLGRIPTIGVPLRKRIEKMVDRTRDFFIDQKVGVIFEELGFQYLGPLDGHNLPVMMMAFKYARHAERPVVIHLITQKGRGYKPAEGDAEKFHALSPKPKDPLPATKDMTPQYQDVFGSTLEKIAADDPTVVAITAAMPTGTGLKKFSERFPKQFFDVGIAEQHAVTFAAGLAAEGMRPVCAIYSTFLQRAYDQVIHDVALQNLPVVFCLDRSGLVGADGPTHHGSFDLSYLRIIPNMVIAAPKDENELQHLIYTAIKLTSGPMAVRYSRGKGWGVPMDTSFKVLPIGKGEVVFESKQKPKIVFIGIGLMVAEVEKAARLLDADGTPTAALNARFVKPLDEELVLRYVQDAELVVTMEDNSIIGGFGSAIQELVHAKMEKPVRVIKFGIPDRFIDHGSPQKLYDRVQLTAAAVVSHLQKLRILRVLE